MSKWVDESLFKKFKQNVQAENDRKSQSMDFNSVWKPIKGTADDPNTYVIRFLPDKAGNFYKKFYYHMFRNGEGWSYSVCPKTNDIEAFCPICAVAGKLFTGTEEDKKDARSFKRKEKYAVNAMIIDDPRDANLDDDRKSMGKVKLYEFPGKVEDLIRDAINDTRNGVGIGAFDPSEGGFDFVLKCGATKPDGGGNSWPEYSKSQFARNPSPVADTEEGINKVIDQTYDIDEHVNRQMKAEEDIVEILKDKMVFPLIESEWDAEQRKREVKDNASGASKKAAPKREEKAETKPEPSAEEVEEDIDSLLDEPKEEKKKEVKKEKVEAKGGDDDDDLFDDLDALLEDD